MRFLYWLAAVAAVCACGRAEPAPGDVFREFHYPRRFAEVDPGSKREGIDHLRAASGAERPIEIPSLAGVTRAEVSVEYWGGHVGTSAQSFRVNGGEWIDIPQPGGTPGKPQCYQRTVLGRATAPVPVTQLREGRNVFHFRAGPQLCHSYDWGFYWIYSFTVRLYYPAAPARRTGRLISPADGEEIGENPRLVAEAGHAETPIVSVEFVGNYEDFNWEGDGNFRQWHYITQRGRLARHIGTADRPPYAVTWETSWVPDQDGPVELAARITDMDGFIYMTPGVRVRLRRTGRSVRMYRAEEAPDNFAVRLGRTKECKFRVDGDLSRARAARLTLSSWSAAHDAEIALNGSRLAARFGLVHNYSFDSFPVPVRSIRAGENVFSIFSQTTEHAPEVNWPGPVLLVEYAGAAGANGAPGPVAAEDGVDCAGQPGIRVRTPAATWCYQKAGAAFSSLTDAAGVEWIGYRPGGRSAGEFRGIPNLGDEFGHPGSHGATTRLLASGPLQAWMLSESPDGKWSARWDIFASYARMTLLRRARPCWFLYEGTPAGGLDTVNGFQFDSAGMRRGLGDSWTGDVEWVYFGSEMSGQVLFLAEEQPDSAPDQYWPMEGNMTVFGFGRQFRCCGAYLEAVPARFVVGLAPKGSFEAVRRAIDSARREPGGSR